MVLRFVADRNYTQLRAIRSISHIRARAQTIDQNAKHLVAHTKQNGKNKWEIELRRSAANYAQKNYLCENMLSAGAGCVPASRAGPKLSANTHTLALAPSSFVVRLLRKFNSYSYCRGIHANVFTSHRVSSQSTTFAYWCSQRQTKLHRTIVVSRCLLLIIIYLLFFFLPFSFMVFHFSLNAERMPSANRESTEDDEFTVEKCGEVRWIRRALLDPYEYWIQALRSCRNSSISRNGRHFGSYIECERIWLHWAASGRGVSQGRIPKDRTRSENEKFTTIFVEIRSTVCASNEHGSPFSFPFVHANRPACR